VVMTVNCKTVCRHVCVMHDCVCVQARAAACSSLAVRSLNDCPFFEGMLKVETHGEQRVRQLLYRQVGVSRSVSSVWVSISVSSVGVSRSVSSVGVSRSAVSHLSSMSHVCALYHLSLICRESGCIICASHVCITRQHHQLVCLVISACVISV